jgi:hypothetical protein
MDEERPIEDVLADLVEDAVRAWIGRELRPGSIIEGVVRDSEWIIAVKVARPDIGPGAFEGIEISVFQPGVTFFGRSTTRSKGWATRNPRPVFRVIRGRRE